MAHQAVKFYTSIGRTVTVASMHYSNVLKAFKEDYAAYEEMSKEEAPTVPLIND